jgi:hypothetical protein
MLPVLSFAPLSVQTLRLLCPTMTKGMFDSVVHGHLQQEFNAPDVPSLARLQTFVADWLDSLGLFSDAKIRAALGALHTPLSGALDCLQDMRVVVAIRDATTIWILWLYADNRVWAWDVATERSVAAPLRPAATTIIGDLWEILLAKDRLRERLQGGAHEDPDGTAAPGGHERTVPAVRA